MDKEIISSESQPSLFYFAPQAENNSPELLFFEEKIVRDSNWKRASEKGRQLWQRLKERYDQIACDVFAGDRFIRRLRYFKKITILLNQPIDPAVVKARVLQMLRDRSYHHLRWLIIDILILPFTILTMPIPGPNVIFYYLLFRIFSHWKAYRSASNTWLGDVDVQMSNQATEVSAFFHESADVKTGLQKLRQRYGLRALQEHKFIAQTTLFKETWVKIKKHFAKST